jgi:hypothetical protein
MHGAKVKIDVNVVVNDGLYFLSAEVLFVVVYPENKIRHSY